MLHVLFTSLRAILVLTLVTSVAYPLTVTAIAQALFSWRANGSLIKVDDQIIGSDLIAQKFTGPGYFAPRPSAADYATMPSGASNQGFTSRKLREAIQERRNLLGKDAPADLLTASGSGLDPHLSPEGARFQAPRVANARGLSLESVLALVHASTSPPQLGFLGQARVNVLNLNLKLDALTKSELSSPPKSGKLGSDTASP